MAGKKSADENTKKGVSKKDRAAATRAADEHQKKVDAEDKSWEEGAKNNAKRNDKDKRDEQKRRKEERDRISEKENAEAAPKPSKKKDVKTRGLDLSQLGDNNPSGSGNAPSLNATGIDNALDALSLTTSDSIKVDKHPERRFKAAYAAYEERRLKQMEDDGSGQGLRLNQKKEKIKKEFEKSGENPFNQVTAAYDSTQGDIEKIKDSEKKKIERRLADK